MKNKLIYLPIGILTGVTVLSAAALLNSGAKAATDTKSAEVAVTVSSSCNFYGETNAEPSAKTISSGTAAEFANTNTLTAVCNDTTGVKIQAIGYSNNTAGEATEGETGMRSSAVASATIPTATIGATCTSATTSGWGFKITSIDNSYDAVVASGYTSYAAVPSGWTKVASYAGTTSSTSGTSVGTSYCVRIGSAQAAGSYTGRVKYRVEQGAA